MKTWTEVAATPEFQALPYEQKEAARNQYFQEVVMPQVPTGDMASVRQQFDADTAIKAPTVVDTIKKAGTTALDSVGDFAKGTGISWGSGSSNAPRAAGEFIQSPSATALEKVTGLWAAISDKEDDPARYASRKKLAEDAADFAKEQRAENVKSGNVVAGVGKSLEDVGKDAADYYRENNTVVGRQMQSINEAKGFWPTMAAMVKNPAGMVGISAQSAPDMVWGMAGGSVASKLTGGLANAAGEAAAKTAYDEFIAAAPVTASRAEATAAAKAAYQKAAEAVQERVAASVGLVTEAVQSGAQNDLQVRDFVSAIPVDKLASQSPRFAQLIQDKSKTPEQWRETFARELGNESNFMAALWNGSMSKVTGAAEAMGKTVTGSQVTVKDLAKNIGKETADETLQNPGENWAQHVAQVQADPTDEYDFGGSVAQGMGAGFSMGAATHGAGYVSSRIHHGPNETPAGDNGGTPAGGQANPQSNAPLSAADVLGSAPAYTPEDEQAITSYAQRRLDAIEGKAGRQDSLTADEKDEREFLRQNLSNPAAIASAYNIKPSTGEQEKTATIAPKAADLAEARPDIPLVRGKATEFSTESGARINADYAVVPAASLTTSHDTFLKQNSNYPQTLQPRERDRQASERQISTIASRLDPARLGESADAATGAPIVGADGLVESGNARTIALMRVYRDNPEKAAEYRKYLEDNAARFGITPESVKGMENPVLVRVRNTPVDRAEFARQANASTVAQMSPSEQAKSDAARIQYLDDLTPTENGDFSTSRDFIRRFVGAMPETERGGMMDAGGQLSQSGYARIRNAVLAKAYGNSPALLRMVESMDDNLRNVSKAMMQAAPQVAKSREGIAQGALYPIDVTQDLLDAVEELSRLREAGISVHDALAQTSLVEDHLRPETRDLLQFLDENIRRPRKIADFIRAYVEALDAVGNPNQGSMFGGEVPGRADLISSARRSVNDEPIPAQATGRTGEPAQESGPLPNESKSRGASPGESEWVAFPPESHPLGIPRAEMPQVKGDHRGALIQFLDGKGITHETIEGVDPHTLKPTQAEFSTKKTERWKEVRDGTDRSILVSSDNYILDGHHQYVAGMAMGEPVKIIKFDAPIRELLAATFEFPSAHRSEGAANDDSTRDQVRQDFKNAMADLADIMTKHTRAAMVPEDLPGLMPTLVKLFEAGIKGIGYDMKALLAHVKKALRNIPEYKPWWNKIPDSVYRKAAAQALDGASLAHVDDLITQAKAVQQDFFNQPQGANHGEERQGEGRRQEVLSPRAAVIDGRPYDMKRDNYAPQDESKFIGEEVLAKARGLIESFFGEGSEPVAPISDEDRQRAQEILSPMLKRAEEAKADYDQKIIDITKRTGAIGQMLAPVKGMRRAAEKLVTDNKFDSAKMRDLLRSTIVVNSYDDARAVLKEIGKEFTIQRVKNKTDLTLDAPGLVTEKSPDGYMDVLVNVETANGTIAEIQINIPAMMAAKMGSGHKLYEISRAAPSGSSEKAESDSAQKELYAAALAASRKSASEILDQRKGQEEVGTMPAAGAFSLSTNRLPSGNSTYSNSTPSSSDKSIPNLQPSGNLSGTRMASTSDANTLSQGELFAYNSGNKGPTEGAENGHRSNSQGGAARSEPGSVQGSGEERGAAGVRDGNGGSDFVGNREPDPADRGTEQRERRPDASGKGGHPQSGQGAGNGANAGNLPGVPASRDIAPKSGRNYAFSDSDLTYQGGWHAKARQNVEAVELLKRLESEGRQATREEQATLAKFIGWGASEIRNALFGKKLDGIEQKVKNFQAAKEAMQAAGGTLEPRALEYWNAYNIAHDADPSVYYRQPITLAMLEKGKPDMSLAKWVDLRDRLQAALTSDEWDEASRSTQYAHYTSSGVVRSMWNAMERMGFKGGLFLEPGAGIGVFPGLMPEGVANNSAYTGVEFDPITGGILKQLFPDERILVESFVDSRLPNNFYDIAIGNPPFAPTKILADPKYKKYAFSLHDYFFAKTIDSVKPGGLVAFVTSRYTMDKLNDKARKYLADRADLVGAVRLPQTAFMKNAGTEVVTDIIFLRKKVDGETFAAAQPWSGTTEVDTPEGKFMVNEYFAAHPEMVLGTHSGKGSMYGKNEYTVLPKPGDIEAQVGEAVRNLPENIIRADLGTSANAAKVREIDLNPKAQKEGNYYLSDAGVVMQREGGIGVRPELSEDKAKVIKDYIGLRDAVKQAQYDQLNNGDWEKSLAALRKVYSAFVKKHGAIKQAKPYEQRVKVRDLDTGEEYWDKEKRWRFPLLAKINDDTDWTVVSALENFNDETGEVTESDLLSKRLQTKPEPAKIETPADALLATLNDVGKVDIPLIAQRLAMTPAEAVEALGTMIYEDPAKGWIMADEYLSGNVVKKLREAKEAAKSDRRFNRNIDALISVATVQRTKDEIDVSLGQNWVAPAIYAQFLKETAGIDATVTYNKTTGDWTVTAHRGDYSPAATVDWGTMSRNAADLLLSGLNGSPIRVTKREGSGKDAKQVFDPVATEAAQEKLDKLREEFSRWVWKDDARAEQLARDFNDKFNNIIPRKFDGRHLTLPGTSELIKVFDHVKRGAWRIIQQGNTYLAHAVGSGKTWQMVIAAMEQKRLGMIQKPMMVVPNHMLQQFAKEWLDLYPSARLMVADEKQFTGDNRRRFVARVAQSNLDGVIITHSAFKLLDLDPEFKAKMIEQELDIYRAALEEAGGSEGKTDKSGKAVKSRDPKVRRIEQQIEALEQQLEAAMSSAGKDKSVRFDEMGVDQIFVDEAHEYRKLAFSTSRQVKGVDSQGSQKAFDLWLKTRWLEEKHPGRSLVMASGTPVTNTMAELYSVQRFMAPDVLEERGIDRFDDWAAMFGREKTAIEPNAAGGYENVTRFSEFANVGELIQMFREFADVLTSDNLSELIGDKRNEKNNAGRPKVDKGTREIVLAPKTEAYREYQQELDSRLKASRAWKPTRDEPNNPDPVIRIIGDGRLSAIDLRFVDPTRISDPDSKLNVMIDNVIKTYKETKDLVFNDKDGNPEPVKGATQVVFSDLGFGEGVTKNRGFNARAWVEKRLRDAGIPSAEIAWMSDKKQSQAKLKLFKDVNSGRVKIVFGSSKNMGTGVNMQQRLIAEHHLDAPWFPADLEQREGRIVRQGNKNSVVRLFAYATKGTYDETMWGILKRKQEFINQALSGDVSLRKLEDLSEASQMEMAMALIAEDPRIMQLAGLNMEIQRYWRMKQNHEQNLERMNREYAWAGQTIAVNERDLPAAEKEAARVKDLSGDNFTAKVDGTEYDKRADWGKALIEKFKDLTQDYTTGEKKVGEISGFDLVFSGLMVDKEHYRASIKLMTETPASLVTSITEPPVGAAMRAVNILSDLRKEPARMRQIIQDAQAKRESLAGRLQAPFEFAEALAAKEEEAEKLQADITSTAAPETKKDEPAAFSRFKSVDIESPEFKRWFGDGFVSDNKGSPRVVYHNTGADFHEFRTNNELGAHFGTIDQANDFPHKERNTLPVYLNIKNPLRLIDDGDFTYPTVAAQLSDMGIISKKQAERYFRLAESGADVGPLNKELQGKIKKAGYDGIVYLNRREGAHDPFGPDGVDGDTLAEMSDAEVREMFPEADDSYIAFDPSQIKSAVSNTGEFSSENPDIRFSRRGLPLGDKELELRLPALEKLVKNILGDAANAPEVRVVKQSSDLPFSAPSDVKGAFGGDAVWIVASNVTSADARDVILHEVMGHYGLHGFFGDMLNSALAFIHAHNPSVRDAALRWSSANKDLIEEWKREYKNVDDDWVFHRSIEEALAQLAEKPVSLKGLRYLAAKVQQALRTLGATRMADQLEAATNAEALDMLRKAGLFVRKGETYQGNIMAPMFSRLSDEKMRQDMEQQGKWLEREAKARGYKSVEDLAERSWPVFEKLAGKWRQQHPIPAYSRGGAALSADDRADAIIADKVMRIRPVDAAMKFVSNVTGATKLTQWTGGKIGQLIDILTPESVKAGVVSDYGIPESVLDRRAVLSSATNKEIRQVGNIIDSLSTLTRAESRVAYQWMNASDPAAADYLMQQLPPESIKVLAEVEKMIHALSKEAVRLGQLSQESFDRNKFAYLRRSYGKHMEELTQGEKASRKRAISILGDQYKGRGMTDETTMGRVKNIAPEWWNRKTQQGKADKQLKGEKFLRLERRQAVGQGVAPIPGAPAGGVKPKLLEVNYWPVNEPLPAKYGSWDQAGSWEVRDTKGDKLVLWRDFTAQEREAMGEIDEVRYAIAKTLHGMIHDTEVGKYLEWLAQNHATKPGQMPTSGEIVEASDRMRDTFKPGTWVKVPTTEAFSGGPAKYGALAGRYLPGPIWNDVRQTVGFTYKPFGEIYSKILGAWKASKTALSPAVHMNNVMANFVMADWHDVTSAHVFKALRILLAATAGKGGGILGNLGNAAGKVAGASDVEAAKIILARFEDSGGSIGTWAAKELKADQLAPLVEAIEKELGLAGNVTGDVGVYAALQKALHLRFPEAWEALTRSKPGKATKQELANMLALYESEDQVFRLAAWLKTKEDGGDDLAAGKVARESFLDYHINAPWIQAARQTALPFLAFTYRAVPMALDVAKNKPWKLAKLALLAGALNAIGYALSGGDEDKERKLLPEEKAGSIWGMVPKLIRMPWNDKNGAPVFLDIRRWIPVGDVFDIGQGHSAIPILPSLVPGGPMSMIFELALNSQQFTGKPVVEETDTGLEKAGKIFDYIYKAFAPNIVLLPGTYAWQGVADSATGKTDAFGRELSPTQAMLNSVGVKVGSYPADVARLNGTRKAQAQLREIDGNIHSLARQAAQHGISQEEFQSKVQQQNAKKQKVAQDLMKKIQ